MSLTPFIRNGSFRGFFFQMGSGGGSPGSVDVTGKQTIFIPASAMRPRQSEGAASLAFLEIGASKVNYPFLGFDSATDEYAQFNVLMPKSWDLNPIAVRLVWSRTSTTGVFTVSWGVSCGALVSEGNLDLTFGSEVEIASVAATADTGIITPESSLVTPSGTLSKNGTTLVFQVRRITANDELAVDARLHGLAILYETDANTDD